MTENAEWRSIYQRRLAFVDAAVIIWAIAGAYFIRFYVVPNGMPAESLGGYARLSLVLAVTWWIFLAAFGTRDTRILGTGAEEYRGVITASVTLFGLVAIVSYLLKYDTARGFVALALPAGLAGLLLGRHLIRQWIRIERTHGRSSSKVLVVGDCDAARHLIKSLNAHPEAGYKPVGAFLGQSGLTGSSIEDLPAIGALSGISSIIDTVNELQADTVAVSSSASLSPTQLRELGWQLAGSGIQLIMAPVLTDIAGPRIHTQPVAGLPLVHVSTPKLTGVRGTVKRVFDVFWSAVLLLLLSPVFLAVALAVKLSSPGDVFYRQERIGLGGETFDMIKFRSMRSGSDKDLQRLLAEQGVGDEPLFKVWNDPRVTPVGRFIRKYSLDELPQLFNVFGGSMSLVGPRPQREAEVALYNDHAHRRLFVKPGMSGLWQVSGRSNLSWEESIRLDLYYVENWSLTQDIMILLKTFRAVLRSEGAV